MQHGGGGGGIIQIKTHAHFPLPLRTSRSENKEGGRRRKLGRKEKTEREEKAHPKGVVKVACLERRRGKRERERDVVLGWGGSVLRKVQGESSVSSVNSPPPSLPRWHFLPFSTFS